ncbi:MAG TPA: hypothetical protein VMW90_03000 [Acidobacteriota bacterium]|nr:hypothetical protein [Acidobacteriota bacterium]
MANEKQAFQFLEDQVRPMVTNTVPDLIKQLDEMVKRIEAVETKACNCETKASPKKVKK